MVKNFCSFFTNEELKFLIKKANIFNKTEIMINTQNYFFQILIYKNKLIIEADDKNIITVEINRLEKKVFFELLKNEITQEIQELSLNI
jgi:hypothetical protein